MSMSSYETREMKNLFQIHNKAKNVSPGTPVHGFEVVTVAQTACFMCILNAWCSPVELFSVKVTSDHHSGSILASPKAFEQFSFAPQHEHLFSPMTLL